MAKGNLLLGTAANSVGDVTMYRREGAQVSRVRVRKVSNPKTSAQCLQRSAFAPAAKFYSPLSIVLERSFEGLSKSKSYSKFLKNAVDDARANDWLLPKGTGFFPLPYKLSQGSLPSIKYAVLSGGNGLGIEGYSPAEAPTTVGALSEVFTNLGCENGDVVTLIIVAGSVPITSSGFAAKAVQFIVDTTSSVALSTALHGISVTLSSGSLAFSNSSHNVIAGAFIVARYENDKWRRSTQVLSVADTLISVISAADYKKAAIASYGATNTGDNPLVYLDGEDLNA